MSFKIRDFLIKNRVENFILKIFLYLLAMAGVLSLLLLLVLLSLFQITFMPREVIESITTILFIPLIMDLILVSPNLPIFLLFFYIIPLLLIFTVLIRIILKTILFPRVDVFRKFFKREESNKIAKEKFGLLDLMAISIGATIGPSTFVLSPYSVKHYGWYAFLGMLLSSISAILLAYGYSKMYYYSKKLKKKIIGGPSFVGNAFGTKHYLYMISRFTLWIGNVSLSAFNLLIAIGLVSEYLLPRIFSFINLNEDPVMTFIVKITTFIILSVFVIYSHERWEKMVKSQLYLTIIFLFLFIFHIVLLTMQYNIPMQSVMEINMGSFDPGSIITGTLSSAAYVYLMIFGFQEVQSLGEHIKSKGTNYDDRLKETTSILKKAMIGGTIFSSIIFLSYIAIYIGLNNMGIEIPDTMIPALDISMKSDILYITTLSTLFLGVMTTYIPSFVASLKHLRELMLDVFEIPITHLKIRIDPYIVIFFMSLLLLTNEEYIIKLTDFSVLVSMSIISISELFLWRRFFRRKSIITKGNYRVFLTFSIILVITLFSSIFSQEIAINSIIFMIIATLMIMFLSYETIIIEIFSIVIGLFTISITPSLINVIGEMAKYGLATPTDIAIMQALTMSSIIIYFIFLIILLHVLIENRVEIIKIISIIYGFILDTLFRLRKFIKYRRQT